ncbi:MAG: hypothetical protein B7733_19430 [Myxococcales bacterium FL481]|nr:MAG: hypothetical protein B7733_19430 [Myxococcales bacterium FL481]
MLFYAVYPFDLRILDPSFDGNPILNSIGPHPHLEIAHTVQWLVGNPDKASKVSADHQALVFRNSKTEKLLPHIPLIPPYLGPGLADTILNKSKCHIYFHNPNIKVEDNDAAIYAPLLAPPLRCAAIKLPIPPILQKLQRRMVQAKGLKAAKNAGVGGIPAAKEALDKATDAADKAKDAIHHLSMKVEPSEDAKASETGGMSASLDTDAFFGRVGKWGAAAHKREKARQELEKIWSGEELEEAQRAQTQQDDIDRLRAEEKQHAKVEKQARADAQAAERESRAHHKDSRNSADRSNKHLDNERTHQREAERNRDAATDADDRAAQAQGEADEYDRHDQAEQRKQRDHEQQSAQANANADEADRDAAEANRRKQDHETDARTAQQLGDYAAEEGKPLTAADEHAKARESNEKAAAEEQQRDRDRARASAERRRAEEHNQEAEQAKTRAGEAQKKANEKRELADKQRTNAWESRRNAAAHENSAKDESQKASEALDQSEESAGKARAAKKRAEQADERAKKAGEKRRQAKKQRKQQQRKLGRSLSPTCDILLPSLTGFAPTQLLHSVFLCMSFLDLLKVWGKVLLIMVADIVDGYLGFVTDALTAGRGDLAKWAIETGGGIVKGIGSDFLRTWATDDTLAFRVPVKFGDAKKAGCVELEAKLVHDPETGETSWGATGKVERKANDSDKKRTTGHAEVGYERTTDADGNVSKESVNVGAKSGDNAAKLGVTDSEGKRKTTREVSTKSATIKDEKKTPLPESPPTQAETGPTPIDAEGIGTGGTPLVQ